MKKPVSHAEEKKGFDWGVLKTPAIITAIIGLLGTTGAGAFNFIYSSAKAEAKVELQDKYQSIYQEKYDKLASAYIDAVVKCETGH